MAVIETDEIVAVTEASKNLPALVREVAHHGQRVLVKNNRPVAVLIGIRRLKQLQEAEDSLADIALLLARILTDGGDRTSLDDVLKAYGVTREELRELES
jgi:prevent-host-death family protein